MTNTEVIAAFIGAVVGFVPGFLAGEFKDWWWRSRRRKAYWCALNAEIELCREMAQVFLAGRVMAPLYRLPTLSYLHSFPALLADGALSNLEAGAVTRFYSEVETLNRGLDQAHAVRNEASLLAEEFERNQIKANKLVPSSSLYTNVRSVVVSRIG